MVKRRGSTTALIWVGWFVAINLLLFHGFLAYYWLAPHEHWLVYHSVTPVKETFETGETLKFQSHTTLKRNVSITFNDIVYCQNEDGLYERFSSQTTQRLHARLGGNRLTIWPYSPGVNFETECYLESNIVLHLPFNVNKHFVYSGLDNGHTFKIVPKKEEEVCKEARHF